MKHKLKVVFDTNIFISAIIFGGNPRQCLELSRKKKIQLQTSRAILLELAEKLREKFVWPEEEIQSVKTEVLEGFTAPNLEKFFEKDGYYDGKIFCSPSRATYTFICDDEVIVLHLDLDKKALFLKGHKITSRKDHPQLSEFLTRFKKCLQGNPQTKEFVRSYEAIVSSLE